MPRLAQTPSVYHERVDHAMRALDSADAARWRQATCQCPTVSSLTVYAAALWQRLRVAVVRDKCHAWLGRSQYKVEKRRWQCTNWIQRARLSERLLLLVPYKPSYAAALWQWLRVAVVRDKCQPCPERPKWVARESGPRNASIGFSGCHSVEASNLPVHLGSTASIVASSYNSG